MQRVRIGLMGLAVVFLLVLLAAAFFGVASGGDEVTRPGSDGAPSANAAAVVASDERPQEPLAELGVAPGGATDVGNIAAPVQRPVIIAAPPAPVLVPPAERPSR
ncbi:hypothetical protein [Sphingomonas montana]|uniref:hypothetical protein n=1 Tax=Sphingomonas montana TaxID=1843236 RepID=UPI00096EFF5D|nr:hypothetical protein [Sphingomonas montana]